MPYGNFKRLKTLSGMALNQFIWPSINNKVSTPRLGVDGDTVSAFSAENDKPSGVLLVNY